MGDIKRCTGVPNWQMVDLEWLTSCSIFSNTMGVDIHGWTLFQVCLRRCFWKGLLQNQQAELNRFLFLCELVSCNMLKAGQSKKLREEISAQLSLGPSISLLPWTWLEIIPSAHILLQFASRYQTSQSPICGKFQFYRTKKNLSPQNILITYNMLQ